jgi:phosphatidylglycerol:prolipoprotein diacylglycerol transferase
MLQTLFRIPLSIHVSGAEVPLFGFGVLLALWTLVVAGLLVFTGLRQGFSKERLGRLAAWVGIGALVWVVPRIWPEGVPIYGYGAMLFLGFLAAAWLAAWRATRLGWDPNVIWDVSMLVLVAGIVGARLFFVIQYRDQFDSLGSLLNISKGGLVYYGGVIGAVAAFAVYTRWKKLPALALCDLLAPSVALGLALGRIGCFLNGCCYGDATDSSWAVHFPKGSVPYEALVRRGVIDLNATQTPGLHPTQLYSAANGLVLCLLLLAFYPWRRRNGQVIALLLTIYPVTRFLIEFLRNDESPIGGTPFTISQNVSVVLFLASLAFWYWLHTRPVLERDRPAPATASSEKLARELR